MKLYLHKAILMAAVLLLGLNSGYALRPFETQGTAISVAKDVPLQKMDEKEAAEALVKLSVPLQKDPKGVVRWIEAAKGEFNDEAMQYLPALSRLEWLEIGGGSVTPSGMENLKGCSSLRRPSSSS